MTTQKLLEGAFAHYHSGRMDAAAEACRTVLKSAPRSADAYHLLGIIAHRSGRMQEAVGHVESAISIDGQQAEYRNTLGAIERASGQMDAAMASFRAALAIDPRNAQAAANLGNALAQTGNFAEAARNYRLALALVPNAAGIHNNLGNVLRELGDFASAIASFETAISLAPDYIEARTNLGYTLVASGAAEKAVQAYEDVLQRSPDYLPALLNLGNVLRDLGEFQRALAAYETAAATAPGHPVALHNLAAMLDRLGRYDEALQASAKCLGLDPDFYEGLCTRGDILRHLGRPAEAVATYEMALALRPENSRPLGEIATLQNYLEHATAQSTLQKARRYADTLGEYPVGPFGNVRDRSKRLRVAFVSGDFRDHAVAEFLGAVVDNIDPGQVEVIAYRTLAVEDARTLELRRKMREWRDVFDLDDDKAATLVRADQIDILVDLSGFTDGKRLGIFARKPAPVQFGWLGYSGTTGLAAMDYILADQWTAPRGSEGEFREQVWRLPDSYICYGRRSAPPVSELPALRQGHITFGSFNNLAKLSEETLLTWAQILEAIPDSRLILKGSGFTNAPRNKEIAAKLQSVGVNAARFTLLDRVPDRAAHLALYDQIDIGLDPFPYNGTTTTCEALWMGVPVLTKQGSKFVARVGESLMQTIGMPDWVAADREDYVARAARLAADFEGLAAVRSSLRDKFAASPLGDGPRFGQSFEVALREMWQRWCDVAHN